MCICRVCASVIHTCAINWMILTKILRGMSLGTTLRLPLGNKVEVMDVRRLGIEGGKKERGGRGGEESVEKLNSYTF